jgi:hypothetical protein
MMSGISLRALLPWALSCVLLALSACGGGGGGKGSDSGANPASAAAPTLVQQPVDVQVVEGQDAAFTVKADGLDLSYQWERSITGGVWSPIVGETNPTLSIAKVLLSDTGHRFRVKVSRNAQVTISSDVALTVTASAIAPSITVQPQSIQITPGADASFTLTASGTSLTYLWQTSTDGTNWVNATGGNDATFVLKAVAVGLNSLRLRALISNGAGSVTSATVVLTVASAPIAPAFASQPTALAVTAPATATFTASVSGTPQPTLQWQKSVDGGGTYADIPGATSASYTTPATSESESGHRFRLIASNSASTATSNAVTLTVSAASTPPLVTTQPLAATVAAGASASFTVGFSGVPTPTVQWQLSTDGGGTFANITGATSSTYSHVVATSESAWLYRAVVSNGKGSVSSQSAKLTVTAASVLRGKAWTTATPLDSGNELVLSTFSAQAIDDKGGVTVLFAKATGGRLALHAVRGTPGGAGSPPVWGTPVVLDADAPFGFRAGTTNEAPPVLSVSPNGNAVAGWNRRAPCTASTYNTNTSATCNYWYSSRYIAAQGNWEAPVLIGDMYLPVMDATINDAGDVAGLCATTPSAGSGTSQPAVCWKAATQSSFTKQVWPLDVNNTFVPLKVTLDSASRLVVYGRENQSLSVNTDIAVHRGTIKSGLGPREIIDLRGATATYMEALGNPQGQQLVFWTQNNGTNETVHAASLDNPTGTWTVTDTGETKPVSGTSKVTLSRTGDVNWYFWTQCASKRRTGGIWGARSSLPSGMCNAVGILGKPVVSANGNVLSLLANGEWQSYDAALNEVISTVPIAAPGPGYLLGFYQSMTKLPGELLLSESGIGVYISVNAYATIPTSALPAGDVAGNDKVWAWLLK